MPNRQDCRFAQPEAAPKGCGTRMCRMISMGSSTTLGGAVTEGVLETPTLQATAALLHRESLVPAEGMSLLDSLDDNSHRHAFAASADLKHALRASIELIGNEAVRYRREVRKERVFRLDDKLAGKLDQEALRYMYRLLFLFYIEARPELGYAPVDSEARATVWSTCATWSSCDSPATNP